METMKHSGFANYQTFLIAVHIDNDESELTRWLGVVRDCQHAARADDVLTRDERARLDVADALRDEFCDNAPDSPDVFASLLHSALDLVDWSEIAEHLMSKVAEGVA